MFIMDFMCIMPLLLGAVMASSPSPSPLVGPTMCPPHATWCNLPTNTGATLTMVTTLMETSVVTVSPTISPSHSTSQRNYNGSITSRMPTTSKSVASITPFPVTVPLSELPGDDSLTLICVHDLCDVVNGDSQVRFVPTTKADGSVSTRTMLCEDSICSTITGTVGYLDMLPTPTSQHIRSAHTKPTRAKQTASETQDPTENPVPRGIDVWKTFTLSGSWTTLTRAQSTPSPHQRHSTRGPPSVHYTTITKTWQPQSVQGSSTALHQSAESSSIEARNEPARVLPSVSNHHTLHNTPSTARSHLHQSSSTVSLIPGWIGEGPGPVILSSIEPVTSSLFHHRSRPFPSLSVSTEVAVITTGLNMVSTAPSAHTLVPVLETVYIPHTVTVTPRPSTTTKRPRVTTITLTDDSTHRTTATATRPKPARITTSTGSDDTSLELSTVAGATTRTTTITKTADGDSTVTTPSSLAEPARFGAGKLTTITGTVSYTLLESKSGSTVTHTGVTTATLTTTIPDVTPAP